jgi:hypothetical protein
MLGKEFVECLAVCSSSVENKETERMAVIRKGAHFDSQGEVG